MPRPVSNPPNPWESTHVDWLGEPPDAKLEIFEEDAKTVLSENDSPDVGFRYSLNPYRGCFHGCSYCLAGDTPILMGDGTHRPLADLSVGDEIYGTVPRGRYRYYERTKVLAHWSVEKPAWRVKLEDGTEVVTSGDHRFLTERGWKYVTGALCGPGTRPHLTTGNKLVGVGHFANGPTENEEYKRGYLCGLIRGDGHLAVHRYDRAGRAHGHQYHFRLALIDLEPLRRARKYLEEIQILTHDFVFAEAAGSYRRMVGIRTHARATVEKIQSVVSWPDGPTLDWRKGFLAGIFDAEGSYSGGTIRISNTNVTMIEQTADSLRAFGFDAVVEERPSQATNVRIRGGLKEHMRFFHTVDPCIVRKRDIEGQAVKGAAKLGVVAVEPLGLILPLYDITTGTRDFIADGVISHNCYARPSHQYWGFGAGTDFERKIVVKVNAPERLRAELMKPSWRGETIVFSGNTDCYQPLEAAYHLTRRCLEVCAELRQPVGIISKGALIRRDVELLARLAREARARVFLSIPFLDDDVARKMEPYASTPTQRFETLRLLSEAGVPTGISIPPLIPGLNDPDVPGLLERARAAGSTRAFMTMLRLAKEVLPVFEERLDRDFVPERAAKVRHAIRDVRGGVMYQSGFGERMHGRGPRWDAVQSLFDATCRRLGIDNQRVEEPPSTTFRRPSRQGSLF